MMKKYAGTEKLYNNEDADNVFNKKDRKLYGKKIPW